MDQTKNLQIMLELIPGPAFAVRDGKVLQCNRSAENCLIEPGMDINDLLVVGQEELSTLTQGCLYLQVQIGGRTLGASVTPMEDVLLYQIEPEGVPAEIKAMNLLCSQLRYPVSTLSMLANRTGNNDAMANHELSRILRILNNVSNAAHFLSDTPPAMEVRNICAVVGELFEECANLLSHAGITLRYTLPDQPIYTGMNTKALKQALYNLLDNAAKFAPEGGVITASLTASGKSLQLRVSDQGEGIPTQLRGGIFSRYSQPADFREGRENLGLGLALVRAAARIHGGTVLVDAPDGTGTRVTMTMRIQELAEGTLRTPNTMKIVTSSDSALVMLSNVLPTSLYDTQP